MDKNQYREDGRPPEVSQKRHLYLEGQDPDDFRARLLELLKSHADWTIALAHLLSAERKAQNASAVFERAQSCITEAKRQLEILNHTGTSTCAGLKARTSRSSQRAD